MTNGAAYLWHLAFFGVGELEICCGTVDGEGDAFLSPSLPSSSFHFPRRKAPLAIQFSPHEDDGGGMCECVSSLLGNVFLLLLRPLSQRVLFLLLPLQSHPPYLASSRLADSSPPSPLPTSTLEGGFLSSSAATAAVAYSTA